MGFTKRRLAAGVPEHEAHPVVVEQLGRGDG